MIGIHLEEIVTFIQLRAILKGELLLITMRFLIRKKKEFLVLDLLNPFQSLYLMICKLYELYTVICLKCNSFLFFESLLLHSNICRG